MIMYWTSAIIDLRHVQRFVTGRSLMQQLLDFVRAGFISEVGDKRKTIEDAAGHTSLPRAFFLPFCIPTTIGAMAFAGLSF